MAYQRPSVFARVAGDVPVSIMSWSVPSANPIAVVSERGILPGVGARESESYVREHCQHSARLCLTISFPELFYSFPGYLAIRLSFWHFVLSPREGVFSLCFLLKCSRLRRIRRRHNQRYVTGAASPLSSIRINLKLHHDKGFEFRIQSFLFLSINLWHLPLQTLTHTLPQPRSPLPELPVRNCSSHHVAIASLPGGFQGLGQWPHSLPGPHGAVQRLLHRRQCQGPSQNWKD